MVKMIYIFINQREKYAVFIDSDCYIEVSFRLVLGFIPVSKTRIN